MVLERSGRGASGDRFSILGFDPVEIFEASPGVGGDWLDRLAERVGSARSELRVPGLPLAGGWVGFIAYEAGPVLAGVRCARRGALSLPLVRFGLYDTLALFDHVERVWSVVAVDGGGCGCGCGARLVGGSARDRLDRLEGVLRGASRPPAVDWTRSIAARPVPAMSRAAYDERVARAKRYIAAGDIYQVNLTQRFSTRTGASAWEVYRRLRAANPGAYSGVVTCGGGAVLCSSPELFLELRDGWIRTRPIKGTRPRTGDGVLDAVRRRELIESAKDRAELVMIVDLLRNDLGRVSEFGSVRVERAADLEAHPTVYHLAATIAGRLRAESGWCDLLRACFPGGSISGCPKIRAMEIIEELETTERSAYCGSVGYIGLDGSMCLNVAIRTMVLAGGRLHLFGGGAIVADSDAESEYEETLAKTAGMVRALGVREAPAVCGGRRWGRSA